MSPTELLDPDHHTSVCYRFLEILPKMPMLDNQQEATDLLVKLSRKMLQEWDDDSVQVREKVNTFILYLCFCSHSIIEDMLATKLRSHLEMTRGKIREFCSNSPTFKKHYEDFRSKECISEIFDTGSRSLVE